MSIVDARSLESPIELTTEVCIVGAGAAGISLAITLAARGRDVCLLEAGGLGPEEEVQALYDLENVGYPVRENFMSRARYFGGTCNLWAGRSMRLQPFDLSPRPWVSAAGWPIDYGALEGYYAAAERLLRLPSKPGFDASAHLSRAGEEVRSLFSESDLAPTVSLWAKRPLRFSSAYKKRIRRDRRIRMVLHANVTELLLSDNLKTVESVEFATLSGKTGSVRARRVVLAAGGIENARLLLISRNQQATGIGNEHDLVGRYFMDHPRAVHGRAQLRPGKDLSALGGRALPDGKVQIGLGISKDLQRSEGLLHHYATLEREVSGYTEAGYHSLIRAAKVLLRKGYAGKRSRLGRSGLDNIPGMIYLLTPKEVMPHWVFRMSSLIRRLTGPRRQDRKRIVVYFCEQLPDRESRVSLSSERDALDLPKVKLGWRVQPDVTRSVLRLQEILAERFQATGVGRLERPEEEVQYTDASHHIGTTRMSSNPREGVVDPNCRVHGVMNLYVAGSSTFPYAGHANPTLTIVALALRLADHLADGTA